MSRRSTRRAPSPVPRPSSPVDPDGGVSPGTLHVVATPLGNLEDITLRALRVLKEADLIAAEDTRHSRKLLAHYGIATPLTSYHDHNEREKAPQLLDRLQRGDSIALICDAGTPGVADPGYRLVTAAIAAGIRVVPVPGPSAVLAALCAGGLPTDRFTFEGFVPAREARRRAFFENLAGERRTIVCFETARRLGACLRDLAEVLGERRIVIARELTKVFEELVRGRAGELRERFASEEARGEVTLLIEGETSEAAAPGEEGLREQLGALRRRGVPLREAARVVARRSGRSRNEIYRLALQIEAEDRNSA